MLTVLKRVDPEARMNRWYRVLVQPTLLVENVVICSWGSRETSQQRTHLIPVADEAAARRLAARIVAQKLRRGYEVVLTDPE
jgi:predicted DNA-binding WGR domain protein